MERKALENLYSACSLRDSHQHGGRANELRVENILQAMIKAAFTFEDFKQTNYQFCKHSGTHDSPSFRCTSGAIFLTLTKPNTSEK